MNGPRVRLSVVNSAHSYYGLFIKDAVIINDVEKNTLQPSPDDKDADVITY